MRILRYPSETAEKKIKSIGRRSLDFKKADVTAVERILNEVRRDGDAALLKYTHRFDAPGMGSDQLAVGAEEFAAGQRQVDDSFVRSLDRAIAQIEQYHRKQLQNAWITTARPETVLGQLINPVDAAGVYVPGGTGGQTPLVSSVLMGAIPAQMAGVPRIVMVTPPRPDGSVHPCLLTAAQKVGIDAVYKIGSAWAIGALAYGTATIAPVDVIVGPGNKFVTLAKKIVAGTVGIDMIAGPSEILIIADDSADPDYVAADLLSQAEHDELSSAILVTMSIRLAKSVIAAVDRQLKDLPRSGIAAASWKRYGAVIVTTDMAEAFEVANRVAPEHLELHVQDPFDQLSRIRNAGAVFLGPYTPEPVGDYIAGPNHVLPTAGTARFSSALSVDHFTKKTSIIRYSRQALEAEADDIIRLAEIEGLHAHAHAVRIRRQRPI